MAADGRGILGDRKYSMGRDSMMKTSKEQETNASNRIAVQLQGDLLGTRKKALTQPQKLREEQGAWNTQAETNESKSRKSKSS